MKQTKNALSMLLNAYRSVYKSAYFKGLASAVVLTAGLAAGAAQADSSSISEWLKGSGDFTTNITSSSGAIDGGISVNKNPVGNLTINGDQTLANANGAFFIIAIQVSIA